MFDGSTGGATNKITDSHKNHAFDYESERNGGVVDLGKFREPEVR